MSNIYLKVAIETFWKLQFSGFSRFKIKESTHFVEQKYKL